MQAGSPVLLLSVVVACHFPRESVLPHWVRAPGLWAHLLRGGALLPLQDPQAGLQLLQAVAQLHVGAAEGGLSGTQRTGIFLQVTRFLFQHFPAGAEGFGRGWAEGKQQHGQVP